MPNCISCFDSSVCFECEFGFKFDPSTSSCIPYNECKTIIDSVCVECYSDSYLDSTSTCIKNPNPCSISQVYSNRCFACLGGYFMDDNFRCVPCDPLCLTCSGLGKCSECFLSSFLNEAKQCETCPSGCDICKNSSTCEQCSVNFELKEGKCVCGLVEGCNPKDNTRCNEGQFFNGSDCRSCRQGCSKCDEINNCTECFEGFLLIDGLCSDGARRY
jgi:hypothetical protein